MSEVISRGVVQIAGDTSGLEGSAAKVKRSLRDIADTAEKEAKRAASAQEKEQRRALSAQEREQRRIANAAERESRRAIAAAQRNARSIDDHVRGLQAQAALFGKSAREAEIYRLRLRGASDEQVKAADIALRKQEQQRRVADYLARRAQRTTIASTTAARDAAAIDNQISKLRQQAAVFGMTSREAELYRLKLAGATAQQLKAADAALALGEKQARVATVMNAASAAAGRLAARAGAGVAVAAGASLYAIESLIGRVAKLQDLAEKTGEGPGALSSLIVPAEVAGTNLDTLSTAAVRLQKNLTGVDDESKAAGAALGALGINIEAFKSQGMVDRFRTLAKAIDEFRDSADKGAAVEALLGKGAADLLPFMRELANQTDRSARFTDEAVAAADKYKDAQAEMKAEIMLSASAIAVDLLPILSDTVGAFTDYIKALDESSIAMEALRAAGALVKTMFQFITLVGSDVVFVFKGIGREVGAIAAQLAALARGDWGQFRAISEAVREDAERARAELDRFQSRIATIGERPDSGDSSFDRLERSRLRDRDQSKKKPFRFSGAVKKDGSERDTAKAQLALDLEQIKAETDALVNAYSNGEKILEARRAAALINEREYYEAKLGFLRLNDQEQERALSREIARLEKEREAISKSKDKDKDKSLLELDKRLIESRAKLAKQQADAATAEEVLHTQSVDALERIARGYVEATIAADAYIESIKRQNAMDLAGIGRGDKFRQQQADIAAMEDRLRQARETLERDLGSKRIDREQFDEYIRIAEATYAEEVRLYHQRTIAIESAQADWSNGMREAMANYIEQARDVSKQSEQLFSSAFQGLEDVLTDFISKGKADFKGFINSIATEITRMQVRKLLADWLGGSGGDILGKLPDILGGVFGRQASAKTAPADAVLGATGDFARADRALMQSQSVAAEAADTTALAAHTSAIAVDTATLAGATGALAAMTAAAYTASAALASVAASGGSSSVGTLFSLIGDGPAVFGGGRAIGGPVSPGAFYRVNEDGPELLSVAGKQYLMMANQAGKVEPLRDGSRNGGTVVHVSVTPPAGASRETAMQWGSAAGRHISNAVRRNGQ